MHLYILKICFLNIKIDIAVSQGIYLLVDEIILGY